MRRCVLPLVVLSWLALLVGGCARQSNEGESVPTLTVFVAASLTDVIQEVGAAYQAEREVELVYNFAGSGALAQQLLAAPRADVFLSASERWMSEVEAAGRLMEGTRRTLLSNGLAVIAHPSWGRVAQDAATLCVRAFEFLAIGDPNSVPAGGYAKEYLQSARCGDGGSIWDAAQGRILPTPDVRVALEQVASDRDVVGVVYRTDVAARDGEVRILYQVPEDEGPAIRYPVAVLKESRYPELARDFAAFLGGAQAREIFERAEFSVVKERRQ